MSFSSDDLIDQCKTAIAKDGGPMPIRDIVERAISQPGDILAELGEPSKAGVQTLYRADDLTILNFAWAPMMTLLPHDHNNIWAVIGLYSGREDNIMWRRTGDTIEASGATEVRQGQATVLGPTVIHSVTNPIPRMTLALHVYGGDFFAEGRSEWDPEHLTQRPFDLEGNNKRFEDANRRFAQG